MENIYVNDEANSVKFQPDTDIAGNNKAKCNYLRCAAVSLGLLCVVLLAAIIGVCVYYNNVTNADGAINKGTRLQIYFKIGWFRFQSSLYLLSTVKKSWEESRKDCIGKGADLVVVNSLEEQKFIHGLKEAFWIGLHDQVTRGSWEWVDGTPLTKLYWGPGEPSNNGGVESCVERRLIFSKAEESWNDLSCDGELFFLCEKEVDP
ncbi:hypothetical protein DPEC_G00165660 [Dallia pectoralis]|uniref:Uncharacterized protein n=1 Tax=Dallia pectoralis TaxID=75939 RepID=A0ACC2GHZ1_DALPE|nr:hypothetical protein DPEC_G00165660 [Dallia pectoralis]